MGLVERVGQAGREGQGRRIGRAGREGRVRSVACAVIALASMCLVGSAQAPKNRLFPPQELGLIEPPDRDQWQPSDLIMDALGIFDGATVAEVGAGCWNPRDKRTTARPRTLDRLWVGTRLLPVSITVAIIMLLMAGAHACQLRPSRALSDEHLSYIQADSYEAVPAIDALPASVQSELSSKISGRFILAGCGSDHCLIHYEHAAPEGPSYRVLLVGMYDGIAVVEWETMVPNALDGVTEMKFDLLRDATAHSLAAH